MEKEKEIMNGKKEDELKKNGSGNEGTVVYSKRSGFEKKKWRKKKYLNEKLEGRERERETGS